MSLDAPTLADRTFDDFLAEALTILTVYADEWTDYNVHDPGITIVELLAWLAESYTYQLDQVTDSHREKYLRLMGTRRQPPTPASAPVSMTPAHAGLSVPRGTPLVVEDGSGVPKRFETRHEVELTAATIAAVYSETHAGETDLTLANGRNGMHFRTFGDRPDVGDALYIGFDSDPFEAVESLTLRVDFHEENLSSPAAPHDEQWAFTPSVDLDWQYLAQASDGERDSWRSLEIAVDETARLYRGGRVVLRRPDGWERPKSEPADALFEGESPELAWLRCVVRTPGYEIPPQVNAVSVNVVDAVNRRTVRERRLEPVAEGPRDSRPRTFALPAGPVLDIELSVDGSEWEAVPDFDASGPHDRHYVVDAERGHISVGDGVRGTYPGPDAALVATRVVVGGGVAGNVPASSTWAVDPESESESESEAGVLAQSVAVTSLGPATGGTDQESVAEALARMRTTQREPTRAVTLEDHEFIAGHTPGLRVARVAASHSTAQPRTTVCVVVPYAPPDVPTPTPSAGFVDAVERQLERHRLLTDRVVVEAPTYVEVGVDVEIRLFTGYEREDCERRVRKAISAFLDPLSGFEGNGWPFGRPLYRSELYEVVDNVDGVDYVTGIRVTSRGPGTRDEGGNVQIAETALFAVDGERIDVRTVQGRSGGRR